MYIIEGSGVWTHYNIIHVQLLKYVNSKTSMIQHILKFYIVIMKNVSKYINI